MPRLPRFSLLVACLAFAGCDVIYERPEPDFLTDFGAPYDVVIGAPSMAPNSGLTTPYVTSDNRLVVDVTYRADCVGSRFAPEFRLRDEPVGEVWVVHTAADGSCETGAPVERRLVLPLPPLAAEVPTLVFLAPDRDAFVLDRAY